ncbi:MAG: glutathione S-transferase, partial [Alphaproteobacteria bacterium]|nr:glutathione S-transferase [Alphaproteobacteria bacterium]
EELAIPYRLERYERDPVTMLAPPEYKALHPIGAAPVITDGDLVLAESGAIMEYIIAKYGNCRLTAGPLDGNFADYLYWLHFNSGTFQPMMVRAMMLRRSGAAADNAVMIATDRRISGAHGLIDTRLGRTSYLGGEELTAADIMSVFTLTTMRYFMPFDLRPYPYILAYLERIAQRSAYRTAMCKADPDMTLLLS